MAGQYQKLVNKQYNSPIGLYSDRSVREILERQSQVLENGAIGIDFNNPMANKPANLQNSAVLRMLEEEENRKRSGQPGSLKRVAWPPPSDSEEYIEQEPVHSQGGPLFTSKSVSPSLQNNHASPQPQPPYQPQSAYQPQVEPHPQPTPVQQPPSPQIQQQPSVRPWQAQQPSKSPTITGSSNATFQPILPPASPLYSNPSAPLSPNISKSPGSAQNQVPATQRYVQPVKQVEPPPSTITLRPQAPVSQAPPPLVTSQPATATLRGGKNLRGDLKWPPEDVKERMAAEKQHLIELQKGPACKPRKQCKDYSSFFAKHALTHAYPGYKIPPGTQFYDHNPVM